MPAQNNLNNNALPFLQGGGEMGQLIRSLNWPSTVLGAPENWPHALKQTASMMLTIRYPVLICWGSDYIQLYNDAFRPINGATKHPQAMGGSARDTYAEIWQTIGPMFKAVMNGETFGFPDFMVPLDRNGQPEDCYFDFSYSPIYVEDGTVGGVLVICMETTEKVLSLRKLHDSYLAQQSLNEEISSVNEELAASNEELRTANEELLLTQQSLNDSLIRFVESEQRFRTMAEGSDILIAVSDETGNAVYFNNAWTELTGRQANELMEFGWADLVHPDDRDKFVNIYLSAFKEQIAFTGEFRMLSKNGDYHWLLAKGPPRFNPDGSFAGYISSSIDITDRKQWEASLEENAQELQSVNEEIATSNEELASTNEELATTNEELTETQLRLQKTIDELAISEAKFKVLIQEAPVAIGLLNGRRLVIDAANEVMLKIWGKTRAVIGKPLAVALPELEGQPFLQLLDDVYTSGNPFYGKEAGAVLEYEGELKEYFFDFIYQPLKDTEAVTTDIIIVAIDVTEQLRTRKEIERTEESLRMAIDAAGLGAYYINVVDRIFYPSARLKEFFGFGVDEEVPYEAAINQIHPDYRQAAADLVEAAITQGVRFDMEYPIIAHNDGSIRWVRGIGTVQQDDHGVNRYFTGVLHDITERKQDEIRKNDFIGMVSHELKTPLTTLTAIVQVLNARFKKSEDVFVSGALDKANAQVRKMSNMINGFLNISRLESGKIMINKHPFNMVELILEMAKETEFTVTSHEIKFEPCDPVMVKADRDKIGSVINNLISNAIKYSPKGKTVIINCGLADNRVEVSVKDEGIGIDLHDKAKLFERYYRVENPNTRHISGFGIGLYLSAEIIHRHEGKIWAESEIGVGSTFYFSLPLA